MEPHGRLLKKNRPWHDWPLHMWTQALYTKIVSQTIKPYCIKNRTTQLVGAYFHFWSDSPHPRWGNKTSITPPRMVVGTCCSSFKTLRANWFFLWIKTCDGYQTWQLSPNLLWIGLHQKKNTPCCHPASRAVWVVAVCDHDGFLCKVGLSWLRLWPNERQVSNYTNGEWKWLEHLGTLW